MKRLVQLTLRAPLAAVLIAAVLLFAPVAFAASAAGAPAAGEIGDHHAPTDQKNVVHFSGALMFWEYLTFGIVLVVLGGVVFPKLLKQLNTRQAGIKDALDKADTVRAQAEVLLKKHEDMMRDAHKEAQKITEEARNAGKEAAVRIQQAAEQASKELKERSAREIELMRRKAEGELRDYAVELALQAGSKVLERSLSGDDHRRLAKEAIAAAGAMKN